MELRRTETGFALYKEKEVIGHCTLHPAAQGAALAALTIDPAWRRKGYGSYLLKEVLRSFGGYDREAATVFTAPLPADCAEMAFWAKFVFAAEGPQNTGKTLASLTALQELGLIEEQEGRWLPVPVTAKQDLASAPVLQKLAELAKQA